MQLILLALQQTYTMLSKKDAVHAPFYDRYVQLAADMDVAAAIAENTQTVTAFLEQLPAGKWDYAYAAGKWTITEMLQHIIDAERVFVYRALTFARMDQTPLPGFDEDEWATNANKAKRRAESVFAEFKLLRASTETFYHYLTEAELKAEGSANNNRCNTLALGYILAGHAAHHMNVIKERYL
jgi:uncharacterized damage-inducible protein DinB